MIEKTGIIGGHDLPGKAQHTRERRTHLLWSWSLWHLPTCRPILNSEATYRLLCQGL